MNIASYVDVEFGDEEAMAQFRFIHLLSHQAIEDYISSTGAASYNFPIDNMENLPDFMFIHNQMHLYEAQALGLATPQDLELYNLESETAFYDWMALNGNEHDRLYLAMGF